MKIKFLLKTKRKICEESFTIKKQVLFVNFQQFKTVLSSLFLLEKISGMWYNLNSSQSVEKVLSSARTSELPLWQSTRPPHQNSANKLDL